MSAEEVETKVIQTLWATVYFQFEKKKKRWLSKEQNVWMDDELTFEYTTHQNSDNILQLFYLYPSVDEVDISE